MNKLLQSSVDHFGIALSYTESGQPLSAITSKLSPCNDYVVVINEIGSVIVSQISSGRSWSVPICGRAYAITVNGETEFAVATDMNLIQRFEITLPTICLGAIAVGGVSSMVYDDTGTMLFLAHTNGCLSIYDLEFRPASKISQLQVSDGTIPLLSRQKKNLIGVDRHGRLFCVRDPLCHQPDITWNGADDLDLDCYALATHPFLAQIIMAGFGPYIRVYGAHNAKPAILVSSFSYIRELVFLSDSDQLAVVGKRAVEVWDLATLSLDFLWQSPGEKVLSVRPNESRLKVIWS